MTIEEALIEFLKKLAQDLDIDIEDDILGYELDELIDRVEDNLTDNEPIVKMVSNVLYIIRSNLSTEEINLTDNIINLIPRHFSFCILEENQYPEQLFLREFTFADEKYAFISKDFFKNIGYYKKKVFNENIDFGTIIRKIFQLIVSIGSNISSDTGGDFFRFLLEPNSREFIMISADNTLPATNNNFENVEKIYSYLYLKYLFKGYKTKLNRMLYYEYNIPENIQLPNDATHTNFFQFIEILDVFDEYHHASDILSKYLKLYQIIEYLMIRVKIVEVQERTLGNKNFFRQLFKELERIKSDNAKDFDRKYFWKLFEDYKDDLIDWFKNILQDGKIKDDAEKYLGQIDTNSSDKNYWKKKLSSLLYELRNSIVHNKEGEYHITIHSGVSSNLIREILTKFEGILFKKLVSTNQNISYKSREVRLY